MGTMAEIFLKADARKSLKGKKLLFLGDSIMRNLYQDCVYLLENGGLTPYGELRRKGEQIPSFAPGDHLVEGTGVLCSGRSYREVREYRSSTRTAENISATYCFLTKCFSQELESFVRDHKAKQGSPDVIMMLSALWDINRWGPGGIKQYIKNCRAFLAFVRDIFPSSTQVIWLTCPPISVDVTGGMLLEEMEFTKRSMRFNVMEANNMVAHNTAAFGYDVVDLHYWMTHQIHKRMPDGVHWNQDAVRLQLNIVLTHFCLSRKLPLPDTSGGIRNSPLESVMRIAEAADRGTEKDLDNEDEVDKEEQPATKKLKIHEEVRQTSDPNDNVSGSSCVGPLRLNCNSKDCDSEDEGRKMKRRRNKFSPSRSDSSSESLSPPRQRSKYSNNESW